MKPLPELLAPAGNPACALAAFDAGADAVYAGLSRFNARERGENFTPDSMGKIIDFAHRAGKKVYVTFNTLIKERELPEAVEQLALLADLGPDALLVQDLGVMRLAREYFPGLPLHASTQMGIHNAAGLKIAAELGASRVVLERQVTLEELADIRRATDLEIEVFIHGALCASLSGCCFFSSYLGGYSGNRGKCKQPCRRRYFSRRGNGFFFSPQDLCTLELLPQFVELGVASLKIEGRLRQPDYVAAAVEAYRMLLDAPPEEFQERLKAARNRLSAGCGRRWSAGFYTRQSAAELIKHDAPGAAGLRCGDVCEADDHGFKFKTARRLHLGDRLRIQPRNGDEGPALTLTRIFVDNAPARRALPGSTVYVCCDKPVDPDGIVFKIGESFPDYSARLAALPPHRERLDLAVRLTRNNLVIEVKNAPAETFTAPLDLAPAGKHPADRSQLERELAASDSACFALGRLEFSADGEYFLPAPVLKSVRREFWDRVKAQLRPGMVFTAAATALDRFRKDYLALAPRYQLPDTLPETVALKPGGAEPALRRALRANGVYEVNKKSDEAILPEFCPQNRLTNLAKAVSAAYAMGIRKFRVTSLYGLELLKNYPDVEITASFPLPVCNSMAASELERFGVSRAMAHLELEREAIEALHAKSPLPLELYRWGRPALLTTRAALPVEGEVRDRCDHAFSVRFDRRDGLTRLFPMRVHSVPRLPGLYDFYDLTNANWKCADTGSFNFDTAWM